jgi:outer membrane protein TolC
MNSRKAIAILVAWGCLLTQLQAQQPFVERPQNKIVWRPYMKPTIPPAVVTNSNRIRSLIRAGTLYLTLQDAIALAIENNLDLQVDRYGPLRAEWTVQRQQAGGPLKGSTSSNGAGSITVSGQGVAGAEQSANVGGTGNSGGGGQSNGSFTQIGPVTPNLDPTLQANNMQWGHRTVPQSNLQISGVEALVDVNHNFQPVLTQGLISGGNIQVSLQENYLKENSPGDLIDPSFAPVAYAYVQQRLLSGRGVAVNSRYIRVAQKQALAANVTFRQQVLNLVAQVANVYFDLVVDQEDLRAKQHAIEFAEKFYEDTKKQISLGAVAGVDIYRAEADLSTRRQDLAISQQGIDQQVVTLKNLLSREGTEDPVIAPVHIVALDRVEVPDSDDLPPLRDLVATAMAKRPDVELDKINNEAQEISALGTANAILPSLTAYAYTLNRAEAGGINPISPFRPVPAQIGGLGTAFSQIFTNQYNSRYAGLNFSGPIRNRADQADLGIDQLQLRQGDLVERRSRNDMVVAISNQMIALRQARARYRNAVSTRTLQQDLLEKEHQKFRLGSSTIDLIIAAERTLTGAQYVEISALRGFSQARVGLDQTLGLTLETNHVSLDEALKGKVERESLLPVETPPR